MKAIILAVLLAALLALAGQFENEALEQHGAWYGRMQEVGACTW